MCTYIHIYIYAIYYIVCNICMYVCIYVYIYVYIYYIGKHSVRICAACARQQRQACWRDKPHSPEIPPRVVRAARAGQVAGR